MEIQALCYALSKRKGSFILLRVLTHSQLGHPYSMGALVQLLKCTPPKDTLRDKGTEWQIDLGISKSAGDSSLQYLGTAMGFPAASVEVRGECEMCSCEHGSLAEGWDKVVEDDRYRIISQKGHLMAVLEDPRQPCALV